MQDNSILKSLSYVQLHLYVILNILRLLSLMYDRKKEKKKIKLKK